MNEQPAIAAAVGMAIALSNEEKDEEEMVLMSLAKIAVEEVMLLEEDGLGTSTLLFVNDLLAVAV